MAEVKVSNIYKDDLKTVLYNGADVSPENALKFGSYRYAVNKENNSIDIALNVGPSGEYTSMMTLPINYFDLKTNEGKHLQDCRHARNVNCLNIERARDVMNDTADFKKLYEGFKNEGLSPIEETLDYSVWAYYDELNDCVCISILSDKHLETLDCISPEFYVRAVKYVAELTK